MQCAHTVDLFLRLMLKFTAVFRTAFLWQVAFLAKLFGLFFVELHLACFPALTVMATEDQDKGSWGLLYSSSRCRHKLSADDTFFQQAGVSNTLDDGGRSVLPLCWGESHIEDQDFLPRGCRLVNSMCSLCGWISEFSIQR